MSNTLLFWRLFACLGAFLARTSALTSESKTQVVASYPSLKDLPSESVRLNVLRSMLQSIEGPKLKLTAAIEGDPLLFSAETSLQDDPGSFDITKRQLGVLNPNAPVDEDFDMELAEINVFRPLFRYRASRVRNQGQQFG